MAAPSRSSLKAIRPNRALCSPQATSPRERCLNASRIGSPVHPATFTVPISTPSTTAATARFRCSVSLCTAPTARRLIPTARIGSRHGLICFAESFDAALAIAEIVEEASRVYVHALAANGGREPDLVPEELIPEMAARFRASYGQPAETGDGAVALASEGT